MVDRALRMALAVGMALVSAASGVTLEVDPAMGLTVDLGHTGPSHSLNNATWEKFLLTDAVSTGAVCLDGSPGGGTLQ